MERISGGLEDESEEEDAELQRVEKKEVDNVDISVEVDGICYPEAKKEDREKGRGDNVDVQPDRASIISRQRRYGDRGESLA